MQKTAHERLREAREAAGYPSASAFANAHDLTESAYRHKENGTRQITVADAKLYAKLLSKTLNPPITWPYIINGDLPPSEWQASVVGYVGAGEAVFPFDDDHAWDPVPSPPGKENMRAAVVRGDSMAPVYRDGDILYFAPPEETPTAILGRDCMVQIVNGPRQIKNLRRGRKRGTYRLYSYATKKESDDVKLEWAASVRWIKRR
jgi:hypothetical protein